MSQDDRSPSRRTLLKGTAGTIGTITVAGAASASESGQSLKERQELQRAKQELPKKYPESDLAAKLEDSASEVLTRLAKEGYIDTADISELSDGFDAKTTKEAETASDSKASSDGILFTVTYDRESSQASAELWARGEFDGYDVRLNVRPEADWQVADIIEDGEVVEMVFGDQVVDLDDVATTEDDDCSVCKTSCGPIYETRTKYSGNSWCGGCNRRSPTCDECPDQSDCSSDW